MIKNGLKFNLQRKKRTVENWRRLFNQKSKGNSMKLTASLTYLIYVQPRIFENMYIDFLQFSLKLLWSKLLNYGLEYTVVEKNIGTPNT